MRLYQRNGRCGIPTALIMDKFMRPLVLIPHLWVRNSNPTISCERVYRLVGIKQTSIRYFKIIPLWRV